MDSVGNTKLDNVVGERMSTPQLETNGAPPVRAIVLVLGDEIRELSSASPSVSRPIVAAKGAAETASLVAASATSVTPTPAATEATPNGISEVDVVLVAFRGTDIHEDRITPDAPSHREAT